MYFFETILFLSSLFKMIGRDVSFSLWNVLRIICFLLQSQPIWFPFKQLLCISGVNFSMWDPLEALLSLSELESLSSLGNGCCLLFSLWQKIQIKKKKTLHDSISFWVCLTVLAFQLVICYYNKNYPPMQTNSIQKRAISKTSF